MKILIVVDVQYDFVYGPLGTPQAVDALSWIRSIVREAKEEGQLIVFTQDTHYANYLNTLEGKQLPVIHCVDGTDGWRVCKSVDDPSSVHVHKSTFGYLPWEDAFDRHEPIDEITLVGFCTDICVISNALILKAQYPDIPINVISKACAGTTVAKHNAALDVLASCQITVVDR